MKAAIRDENPVIYFEHKGLFPMKGDVPEGEHLVEIGKAARGRNGCRTAGVRGQQLACRQGQGIEDRKSVV